MTSKHRLQNPICAILGMQEMTNIFPWFFTMSHLNKLAKFLSAN